MSVDLRRLGRSLGAICFGFALGAVAVLAQLAVSRTGVETPLLFLYPAVLIAAWWGGTTAGVTAIVTTALGLASVVLPPRLTLLVAARRDAEDLLLYVFVASLLVAFAGRARRALDDAIAARAIAEAAVTAKETMIGIVAHDLRNPLQTIGLNAELLAARSTLDDRLAAALERLRRATTQAYSLVDDILENAISGRTLLPIRREPLPLARIVYDTVDVFEQIAADRSITFVRPAPASLQGNIFCDRDRLVQALTNVLGNAFQFTPSGGRVVFAVHRTDGGVRFTVTDTGCGMTRDELAHAFERLWHGERPGHGSGLGLWLAAALIEAHGGQISATSVIGRGTTMECFVPAMPEEEQVPIPSGTLVEAPVAP